MLLPLYKLVPSGMSFDLDTSPARTAYMLSTPGNAAIVAITGSGLFSVEVLAANDGMNYSLVATLTTPGQRRYDTKGVAAIAIRCTSWAGTGVLSGQLSHGGLIPATNVSPVFGSFLTFSYNSTAVEPPAGNQIRFNHANFSLATKCWVANTAVDGVDQYFAIRHIPYGGSMLLQNKTDHNGAVLFTILAPPIDKGAYIEVPVAYQQGITTLNSQQAILAVFNPGAQVTFAVTAIDAFLSPDVLPILPEPTPTETPDEAPRRRVTRDG